MSEFLASQAYVSLLVNDNFFPGISVLSKTLKRYSKNVPFYIMVTENVSQATSCRLSSICKGIIQVDVIPNPYTKRDSSWAASELTKLNIWNQTQFTKIVYIDADALVMDCIDELFELNCDFAASPDIFPPDRFNAGVMFLRPNQEVFNDMIRAIPSLQSYDGGDTGFLNAYYNDWYSRGSESRLSFSYNAQRTLFWFTHERSPDVWESIKPIKILHYSSSPKPWEICHSHPSIGELELFWWQQFLISDENINIGSFL